MALRIDQPIRIRPVSYNHLSEPDPSLVSGEFFNCNNPFLILSSRSIPKDQKVYMEVTITEHPRNDNIRHIPLYLGVHKEPSMGVLANDCILGSLYYTMAQDYEIRERHRGSTDEAKQNVPKLYARIPIVGTVIGMGVSIADNTITFYSDGKLFYTITPTTFIMANSTDRWYFAIYNELYETLHGRINYGRYKTKFLPEGYINLYNYLDSLVPEKPPVIPTPPYDPRDSRKAEFMMSGKTENIIAPIEEDKRRHPRVIVKKTGELVNNNTKISMTSNPDDPDMATINFPCPIDQKVYIEITVKEGTMKEKIYGIPMIVGISDRINDDSHKSFALDLFHRNGDTYLAHSTIDGEKRYHRFEEILNPSSPVQPITMGILFDLQGGYISIITDNSVFSKVPIQRVSFDDEGGLYYIYFKSADDVYTGELSLIVNSGEDRIDFDLNWDEKTVYDYWNDSLRFYLEQVPEFECRIKVRPYYTEFNSFFPCTITVPRVGDIVKGFTPGLNMLMDSYNVITDTEKHINSPEIGVFDFYQKIREDMDNVSVKKPLEDIGIGDLFDCRMTVENDRWNGYTLLEGTVTFSRIYSYDMDMMMVVTDKPKYAYKFRREILAAFELTGRRHVKNLLKGTLTLEP